MAYYNSPIFQYVFNPNNFDQIYQITNFVSSNVANIFTQINTFMTDVFINGTIYANDIQILNSFLVERGIKTIRLKNKHQAV